MYEVICVRRTWRTAKIYNQREIQNPHWNASLRSTFTRLERGLLKTFDHICFILILIFGRLAQINSKYLIISASICISIMEAYATFPYLLLWSYSFSTFFVNFRPFLTLRIGLSGSRSALKVVWPLVSFLPSPLSLYVVGRKSSFVI